MRILSLIAVFACATVFNTSAQTNITQELSLRDCIELALKNNLRLEVDRISPELSRHSLQLSLMSYDPSFRLSTDFSTSSSPGGVDDQNRIFAGTESKVQSFSSGINGSTVSGLSYGLNSSVRNNIGANPGGPFENSSGSASFNVRQPLLRNSWIDSTRMNIRISRNSLRSSQLGLEQAIAQLVTRVERAYYDLILARNSIQVQEQALRLTEELLRANRQRVQVGVMAPLDEKQTESQLAARQASLRSAQRSLVSQSYGLKRMLTDDIATWRLIEIKPTEHLIAVPQKFDLHESWGIALRQRPDLLQARIGIENDGVSLKFRRNQLYPSLDVVASAGYSGNNREYAGVLDDVFDGDSPRYSVGAVLNFPISNRAQRKQYQMQKVRNRRSLLNLKDTEQSIMTEVALNIEQAQTAYDQIATTRTAREFAEIALRAEEKKLEIGKSTSFVVLQLQRDLTSARSSEINALADYNKALATLAQSEGRTLVRHKLEITQE
ncbi:MAG: TolC family protein [Limisphaerales bacterium]